MARTIALATLVAGALDIIFAMTLTTLYGRDIGNMLRYVGSGPFPAVAEMGAAGAAIGLLTHFGLMAIMAAAFVLAVRQKPALIQKPMLAALAYGLITYVAMNLIVVPLRFDTPLPPKPMSITTQLFAHIVLVGIPMALIASRDFRSRALA